MALSKGQTADKKGADRKSPQRQAQEEGEEAA